MPFVEIRVLDPDGREVADGEIGEFHIRTPAMFSGYHDQPDATAAVLRDGWYRTGDLGRRDADGLHYVVDRVKDLIITGGENVYSIEVERALARHPAVASVAVVGLPDERWGERVAAFVTLRPGTSADEQELRAHCKELIAGYKVPKSVSVEDSLPTTPSGKIQKAALRDRAARTAEWRVPS
jgi:acyl-CoA synthetase (AMP-forming)/AMP-acid ligase II